MVAYLEEGTTVRTLRVLRVETRNDELCVYVIVFCELCVCRGRGGASAVLARPSLACGVTFTHLPALLCPDHLGAPASMHQSGWGRPPATKAF